MVEREKQNKNMTLKKYTEHKTKNTMNKTQMICFLSGFCFWVVHFVVLIIFCVAVFVTSFLFFVSCCCVVVLCFLLLSDVLLVFCIIHFLWCAFFAFACLIVGFYLLCPVLRGRLQGDCLSVFITKPKKKEKTY